MKLKLCTLEGRADACGDLLRRGNVLPIVADIVKEGGFLGTSKLFSLEWERGEAGPGAKISPTPLVRAGLRVDKLGLLALAMDVG